MASGSWKPSTLLGSGDLRAVVQSLAVYLDDVKGIIRSNSTEIPPNPKAGWTRYDQDADQFLTYTSAGAWLPLATMKGWTAYTPTATNITVGNGSVFGAYTQIGKTTHFRSQLTVGTTTTLAAQARLSLPVVGAAQFQTAVGWGFHSASGAFAALWGEITNSGSLDRVFNTATNAIISGTVPFAWASGDILVMGGTYEAA